MLSRILSKGQTWLLPVMCHGGRDSRNHGRQQREQGIETRRIIRRINCSRACGAQASPGPLFRERGSDETNACAKFRLMDFRFSPSPLTSQAKLCP